MNKYSYVSRDGKYDLDFKNPNSDKSQHLDSDKLIALYHEFLDGFPLVSIEDPFAESDWDAWTKFTASTKVQVMKQFFFFVVEGE